MGSKPDMLALLLDSCCLMSFFPQHRTPSNSRKREWQDVAGALRELRLCKTTSRDSRVAWTNSTIFSGNGLAMNNHESRTINLLLSQNHQQLSFYTWNRDVPLIFTCVCKAIQLYRYFVCTIGALTHSQFWAVATVTTHGQALGPARRFK